MKLLQLCPKARKSATEKTPQYAEDLQSGLLLFTQNKVHKYQMTWFQII